MGFFLPHRAKPEDPKMSKTSRLLRFSLTSLLFILIAGCQSPRLAPESEAIVIEKSGSLETVVILGTNDIHGAFVPEKMRTKDESPIDYVKGGLSVFSSHLKRQRAEFGNRLLWLDGGDEWMGSLDSNLDKGKSMVDALNRMGLDAAAVGNHEFDFGPAISADQNDVLGNIKERIAQAKYPYLAANIFDAKTGKVLPIPGTKTSTILNAGRLKVGVIGISTVQTPDTTRPSNVKDLVFKDPVAVTIKEAKKLREDGANIVVIVTHAGLFCDHADKIGKAPLTPLVKSEKTPQSPCSDDEVPALLRKLPEGTVDAVVSGHTHSLVTHWVSGVPVIQAGTRSTYYNLLYLTYDFDKKQVVRDRTRIQGPIPICTEVFSRQGNCNGDAPAPEGGRGRLVTAELDGKAIGEDSEMLSSFEPIFARTKAEKEKIIGHIARKTDHLKREESPLGNLVADAIRDAVGADVAVTNAGGIRTDLQQGPLTYEALYRALPFDNYVSTLELTGSQLKRFLRISESGSRGYFPVSGVKLKLIRLEDSPWSDDLNGDHKLDLWEADRLIEARLENGDPIENSKTYKVATIDYLVGGGDYYQWYMGQIPKNKITQIAGPTMRDAVVQYLAKLNRPINAGDTPLVRPDSPRLILMGNPGKRPRTKAATSSPRRQRKRHK